LPACIVCVSKKYLEKVKLKIIQNQDLFYWAENSWKTTFSGLPFVLRSISCLLICFRGIFHFSIYNYISTNINLITNKYKTVIKTNKTIMTKLDRNYEDIHYIDKN